MAPVPGVSYAFQPMLSTRTGRLLALEALARPEHGTVHDVLRDAARADRLVEVDAALAAGAVRAATTAEVPLHVNVLAKTATRPDELLDPLLPALRATGRQPADVTVEVTPPFGGLSRDALLDGLKALRQQGFRVAFDGAGDGDLPLSIVADALPDMVKLDAYLLAGVPDNPAVVALIEALGHLASRTGIRLAAVGVESEDQLAVLSRLGVPVAQGNLMAAAQHGTPAYVTPEVTRLDGLPVGPGGPLVADLVHPAVTLPESATSEEVRQVFVDSPEVSGVVLIDSGAGRGGRCPATGSCSPSPDRTDTRCTRAGPRPGTRTRRAPSARTPRASSCWRRQARPRVPAPATTWSWSTRSGGAPGSSGSPR